MTSEFARNKPSRRELARWRDLLLLTRSSAEMYFLNEGVQYDQDGEGAALCRPECGHPAFKVGRIQASNVECGIGRVDVDFLASWRLGWVTMGARRAQLGLHGSFETAACPREIWSRTGSPGPNA